MTHIPDEAVKAKRHLIQSYDWSFNSTGVDAIDDILSSIADAAESYHNTSQWKDEGHIDRIQKYADVAAAHLSAPCAVEVVKLDWLESDENWFVSKCLDYAVRKSDLGAVRIKLPRAEWEVFSGTLEEAKAAAQADFERRILSCVVTKPVDVPALLQEVSSGERDGFINTGKEPHGNDADLSCPCCGGSGHKDDAKPVDVAAGLEQAAKFLDQRVHAYVQEHGMTDPSTGVVEFPGWGDEYVSELEDLAEAIRALSAEPA